MFLLSVALTTKAVDLDVGFCLIFIFNQSLLQLQTHNLNVQSLQRWED